MSESVVELPAAATGERRHGFWAQALRRLERLEQELRFATRIQQQFLPHELPDLPDWQVAAYYGPARAVGGDFYDFIPLPDGRIFGLDMKVVKK